MIGWDFQDLFFQAEDGIRDVAVTGVQTCALPICAPVACLSACAAVTWSACTWVSSVYLRARPCSRRRRMSRSTCSVTGSISTASWLASSAVRYVRVDDAGSKSWLKDTDRKSVG